MPRPWRLRYVGARYHLTGRGNGRETIFHDSADYARFLAQLDAAADAVVLYAYVLMPNHYHLFIDYRWLRLMGRRTDGGRRQAYGRFVEAMLVQDDALFLSESARSRCAIGDERFREESEQELKDLRLERAVRGDILWPEHRRPDVETVAEAAAAVLQIRVADARFHGHRLGLRKYLLVEWCCRLSSASQRAVGEHLRYGSESAVGKARKKAQAALATDPALA